MSSLRVRYQTIEFGNVDIHLRTLRDLQEFQDDLSIAEKLGISSASWPIFGVVWPSSLVLAHFLMDYQLKGKRILEVGCGIGLVSILLNHLCADITATDYHPEVETFLVHNAELNGDEPIPFQRTGWGDNDDELGSYDLIVGSDLLYEQEHIALLSSFMATHANPACEIVVVDPGRGNHAKFSKRMKELGFSHKQSMVDNSSYLDKPFGGRVLCYRR